MPYIGAKPVIEFTTIPSKDSFTGDGSTTTFDLANAVATGGENALEVFVNNVRQEPGSGKAFTLGPDGSNDTKRITFTAAPASGAAIYVINDKTNYMTLLNPKDLNGVELILDVDGDTSITADTDDRIDLKIGSVEHISFGNSSGDTIIKPMVDAKDIVFQQYDGNKILEINDGNYVAISGAAAGPGELRFYEDTDNGALYTGFKAGNVTSSVSYVLPTADGTSGYQLTTDGSGTLSWAAAQFALGNDGNNRIVTGTGSATLNAEANLTFDGSTLAVTGAATVSTTLGVTGVATFGTHVVLGDNDILKLGASTDLTLYHDGTNSYITNAVGALKIATETSGIAVTIGHTTSETTVADNLTVTGTLTGTLATAAQGSVTSLGTLTTLTVDNVITNGATIGHTSDTDLMTLADGVLTVAGELDATTLDISGNADIDGTTNLDAVDIDGAVQIDAAVTVGVDDTGYDVKFFGDTASAYMLWDTSTDDLVLAGAAGIDLAGDIDVDGTSNLDAVDIDGAVQIDATFTSGVDGQGYDTKFFGDTASAYMLWDTSADDLVFAGAAGIDLAGDIDVDGTANLDIVDIDGAVDMASTLAVAGVSSFAKAANVAQGAITSSSNAIAWDASAIPNAYHITTENTTLSAPTNA
ncbi:MAG: hypothetical protein H8D84_00200, partial [Proteobacteria bacterium]|nr:hypothetical protein [Pseudomonadota bacterium]